MKNAIIAGLAIFGLSYQSAIAACTTPLTQSQIVSVLSNRYACGSEGSQTWNELHQGSTASGGNITDYKKGPADPIDPSKTVGTYSVTAGGVISSTVRYVYTVGGTYSYVLQAEPGTTVPNPGTYRFCRASPAGTDLIITVSNSHC